jgi:hypothetical protein
MVKNLEGNIAKITFDFELRNPEDNLKFNYKKWVKDVKDLVANEVRNLKKLTLTRDDLDDIWAKFDKSGLTGIQLESKINFWGGLIELLKQNLKSLRDTIQSAFYSDLKKALKATNILLRSIISVVPGFEPLIELKDFFELSLELREDIE